jgi:hypothetical protein
VRGDVAANRSEQGGGPQPPAGLGAVEDLALDVLGGDQQRAGADVLADERERLLGAAGPRIAVAQSPIRASLLIARVALLVGTRSRPR